MLISLTGITRDNSMRLRNPVWILLLVLASGCGPKVESPSTLAGKNAPPAPVPLATKFDETKGYLHKQSGVGFVYPAGWEREDPKGDVTDTSLGLGKPGIARVSLFWTEIPNAPANIDEVVGQEKFKDLHGLYKDKVTGPDPISVAGQQGFECPIKSGPMGDERTYTRGTDINFLVHRGDHTWIIEMRASAKDEKTLKSIRSLLDNYRVMEKAANP
jgi:hypothetical protein